MALILASSSAIRRSMLCAAGVEHDAIASAVDEAAVKARHADPPELAAKLAEAKALSVGRASSDAWVVGSDSIASVANRMFDKPGNRDEAAEHLRLFSGKPLRLTSAVALACGDRLEWTHVETATLHVRQLSERFIEDYLDHEWPEVGQCVGVFRLEGRGVQLFERIEGDYFTILGMPLLPLLGALRRHAVLPE